MNDEGTVKPVATPDLLLTANRRIAAELGLTDARPKVAAARIPGSILIAV